MKTTARFILSAATGLGLAVFTLLSAFTVGANAPAAVIGFSLLAIYGMIEIAFLSYAPPRFAARPAGLRPMSSSRFNVVRIPASRRPRRNAALPAYSSDRRAA